jgi:hypothetical protein
MREFTVRIDYEDGEYDVVVLEASSYDEATARALLQNPEAQSAFVLTSRGLRAETPLVTFCPRDRQPRFARLEKSF